MDIYLEKLVKQKQTLGNKLFLTAVVLLFSFVSFYLMFNSNSIISKTSPFVVAAFVLIIFFLFKWRTIEFEYIFTNDIIDIDVILGGAKEKRSVSFDSKKIRVWGRYTAELYENYEQEPTKLLEAVTFMEDRGIYFIIVDISEEDTIGVFIQPSDEMLEVLEKYASNKKIELN